MAISEAKVKIVIDNYFPKECDVNTSIRAAFEKGFRLGLQKAFPAADARPVVHGRWIPMTYIRELTENGWPICRWEKAIEPDNVDGLMCSKCGEIFDFADARNFCTQCGSDMRKVVEIDQVKEGDT